MTNLRAKSDSFFEVGQRVEIVMPHYPGWHGQTGAVTNVTMNDDGGGPRWITVERDEPFMEVVKSFSFYPHELRAA